MIRRIQALNYRCLRFVDVDLDPFNILVGPNASGKSTLLDVIEFLGDLVSGGLGAAVEKRTQNFQDLVWGRPPRNPGFELAVEIDLPEKVRARLPTGHQFTRFRYEVAIREREDSLRIDSERGMLIPARRSDSGRQLTFFPDPPAGPDTILRGGGRPGMRTILRKSPEGRDTFNVEVSKKAGKGWVTSLSFGPVRSTLGNLPESTETFPAATHAKRLLEAGIQRLFLDSARMRRASPPERHRQLFSPDGSNLPRIVRQLEQKDGEAFRKWLDHIRCALSGVRGIRTVAREEDRNYYLMIRHASGVDVPSWMASDGTLRLLALTLPAYLQPSGEIYLVEEPENGLHPHVIEAVYDSLSSVYDSQVLLTTHSSMLLSCANADEVLCFAKNECGATDVVRGRNHPELKDWKGSPNLSVLHASGVLD